MSSLIMLPHEGVASPLANSERRGGLLVTSGIKAKPVFASDPTREP
jgi:hypothetical protein